MWKIGTVLMLLMGSANIVADNGCTDRAECWPEGSAMHTMLSQSDVRAEELQRLATKHKKLMNLLASSEFEGGVDSRVLDALKAQQEIWLSYVDAECELVGALSGAFGSWSTEHVLRCKSNHISNRLRRVNSATRCILRLTPSDRQYGQADCLQQLAPLTNL